MERYAQRKGLSAEQIKWAQGHDWYVRSGLSDDGYHCVTVQEQCTDDDGQAYTNTETFADFVQLRAWAGY